MIFLKKIDVIGFKSFANKTIINFNEGLIGIVGPNGSGKSNISDAIKWVFGIQSVKYLRSNISSDIIFNGSESKQPSNYAQVKLLFDNSNRIFNIDYDEVEISRRLFRDNSESEYYINNTRCKLKNIKILAKESGLSQTSISIISQGNVADFAQAKPLERRLFLEDACGVSKYKQYKYESNKKLEHINNNLIRLKDIINEIERKIPNLKKEYEKALNYKKISERLKKIEINILITDISIFKNNQINNQNILNNLNATKTNLIKYIEENNLSLLKLEDDFNNVIDNLENLNKQYNSSVDLITNLKIQKLKLEQNINGDDKIILSKKILLNFKSFKNDLEIEINRINNLSKNIEINQKSLNIIEKNNNDLLINKKNIKLKIEENDNKIFKLNHKILLINRLFYGVDTILKNKKYLSGILCIVKDLIVNIDEKYNMAFSCILKNNLQNIIVENRNDAKIAIDFLKNNKAGNATFIPLDVKLPKQINDNELFILKSINGFINVASDLIDSKNKYRNVILYLLSRHIICNDIDAALQISKLTNYYYTVTTLDGTQIKPFGILTGGFKKQNDESLLFKKFHQKNLEDLKKNNELFNLEKNTISSKIDDLENDKNNKKSLILQNNFLLINAKNAENKLKEKIINLKKEHKFLTSDQNLDNKTISDSLLNELQKQILIKDKLEQSISFVQNNKINFYTKIQKIKQDINYKNIELNNLKNKILELDKKNYENDFLLKDRLQRLVFSYNMTYDYAKSQFIKKIDNEESDRKEIKFLKFKLKNIKNVNLSVIDEYKSENKRYSELKNEYLDLKKSINIINDSIKKMDEIIINKFSLMIKKININLIKTFGQLFNGGKSKLIYTNPNDILNTGIEIEVHPPGKKINNINLLSGGEKSLVALSVLFAILESNGLPLVILDEVEAPLDFNNLKYFGKYLLEISKKVQFIIVTHRISTMEFCDTLYGITMQEKGISNIFSVELLEAKKMQNKISDSQDNINKFNQNKTENVKV